MGHIIRHRRRLSGEKESAQWVEQRMYFRSYAVSVIIVVLTPRDKLLKVIRSRRWKIKTKEDIKVDWGSVWVKVCVIIGSREKWGNCIGSCLRQREGIRRSFELITRKIFVKSVKMKNHSWLCKTQGVMMENFTEKKLNQLLWEIAALRQ